MNRFPPPPPGAERRAYPRHDVVVSVDVAHDDVIVMASLTNISHGGAFVALAEPDPVLIGLRVRIHVVFEDLEAIEEARVVRVTAGAQAGLALAWTKPSAAIGAIVERLTASPVRAATA